MWFLFRNPDSQGQGAPGVGKKGALPLSLSPRSTFQSALPWEKCVAEMWTKDRSATPTSKTASSSTPPPSGNPTDVAPPEKTTSKTGTHSKGDVPNCPKLSNQCFYCPEKIQRRSLSRKQRRNRRRNHSHHCQRRPTRCRPRRRRRTAMLLSDLPLLLRTRTRIPTVSIRCARRPRARRSGTSRGSSKSSSKTSRW